MIEQGYDFYLADTDAGKSIHFGLRYQVYCLQKRYEDPNLHPNFLEQDRYDDMAVHFIARCRMTGIWLGTMRLVVGPLESLPLAKYTTADLPRNEKIDYAKLAEASRLCTTLPFQNRSEFSAAPLNGSRAVAIRALHASMVTIGLIRAARRYSLEHGIVTCLFVITDSFARVLKRLGMEIEPIGSPCQYRGWRRPYAHNFATGYRQMEVRSPELYKSFCQAKAYSRYSQIEAPLETMPLAAMA